MLRLCFQTASFLDFGVHTVPRDYKSLVSFAFDFFSSFLKYSIVLLIPILNGTCENQDARSRQNSVFVKTVVEATAKYSS